MTWVPLPAAVPEAVLSERVILITGAGGGLGSAAAYACARAGAVVVLLDKKLPKLHRTYDAIAQVGREPLLYPLDMEGATPDDYQNLAERLRSELGRLDGILHCAAEFQALTPLEYTDPLVLARAIHVNLTAACWLSQACLPLLKRSADAALVFVLDDLARMKQAYWGGYGMTQHALGALVGMWHEELVNSSVRVAGLQPGSMRTALRERAYAEEPDDSVRDPQVYADACVRLLSAAGGEYRGHIWTPSA